MPSLRQSQKPLHELPQRLLKFAELLAEGLHPKADCMRLAGFADSTALSASAYIGKTRAKSKYPALWDYYQKLRNERLRLFEISAESIRDELKLIAFSRITDFVHIPTRKELERQKLFDAKIRKQFGYDDAEDKAILDREHEIRESLGDVDAKEQENLRKFAPGAGLKLRCLEDIPEELLPAIQSLEETRDGIKIKLYNKLEALDKLARIAKLYDAEGKGDKPTTIENLNLIVNGTQSDLLDKLKDI
jgi:hypothetical protein